MREAEIVKDLSGPGGDSVKSGQCFLQRPLSEIAEIVSGLTKGRRVSDPTTMMPYLRVANVQAGHLQLDEVKQIEATVEEVERYRLQNGDVLMTEGGDPDKLGRGALWDGQIDPCLHQNHIFRVRLDTAVVEPRYFARFLAAKPAVSYFLRAAKQTTGIATINKTQLGALPVPLPPLSEQRRIADMLDKADAIRSKRKEAIAITEELLRSAFLEIFGDPVTNPKGWPIEPLGSHLGFITSGSRGWAEHYADEGERFIRSLDVQMDRIADEDPAYVTAPPGAEAERTRVQRDDVLLTITGSKIGRAARATARHAGAYVSQHVAIMRVLPGLDADVVAAFLVCDRGGQALITRMQYGQTKPGLNLAQIRAFSLPVPPQRVQVQIREVRARLRANQERLEGALSASKDLFASLTSGAFSQGPQC